jgi:hypothetical protein
MKYLLLDIFTVALTITCVALTIAFLGTLRGIAEVRLRLAGAGAEGNQFRLDAGTGLPEGLLAVLPDPRRLSLLLFLSEDCPACWKLLDDLRAAPIEGAQVAICINSDDPKRIRARLGPRVTNVDGPLAAQIFKQFNINTTPVAVVHRDGYVVGSAYGASAESIDTLRRLWLASTQPNVFQPQEQRPNVFQPQEQLLAIEHKKDAARIGSGSEGGRTV